MVETQRIPCEPEPWAVESTVPSSHPVREGFVHRPPQAPGSGRG